MTARIRKHVRLEPQLVDDLERLLERRPHSTLSREVNEAVRDYLTKHLAGREDVVLAPVMEELLNEKNEQVEAWLRPAVWGGATYAATATLLLLELLCGQRVDPKDAKTHLQLIRGRAWKMVRSQTPEDGGG